MGVSMFDPWCGFSVCLRNVYYLFSELQVLFSALGDGRGTLTLRGGASPRAV